MKPLDSERFPDLGPVTPDIVETLERAASLKPELRKKLDLYSTKSQLSIRDRLTVAYFRNMLSLLDPPLPAEDAPIGMRIWKYWANRPEELCRISDLSEHIVSYLVPPATIKESDCRSRDQLLDLLSKERFVFLATFPIVDEPSSSPGRPITRRPTATNALQMKLDGKSWRTITNELCDCRKEKHDYSCIQTTRQSVIGLKRLLHVLDNEVSQI